MILDTLWKILFSKKQFGFLPPSLTPPLVWQKTILFHIFFWTLRLVFGICLKQNITPEEFLVLIKIPQYHLFIPVLLLTGFVWPLEGIQQTWLRWGNHFLYGLLDVWLFVVEIDTRIVPRLTYFGFNDPDLGRHQRWVIYKHNLNTRNSVWYLPQTAAIQVIWWWQRSVILQDMLFTLAGFTRYLLTWMGSGQFGCSAGN